YFLQPFIVLRWLISIQAPNNYTGAHDCWRIVDPRTIKSIKRLCPVYHARICKGRFPVPLLEVVTYDRYPVMSIPEVVRRVLIGLPNSTPDWTRQMVPDVPGNESTHVIPDQILLEVRHICVKQIGCHP